MTWQAIRATGQRLWEDWFVEISVALVLVTGLLVDAFDRCFIILTTNQFWSGPVTGPRTSAPRCSSSTYFR